MTPNTGRARRTSALETVGNWRASRERMNGPAGEEDRYFGNVNGAKGCCSRAGLG